MKTFNKKKGFTIVELVIVIAVIGVLTAVLVPTFVNLVNKANRAADESLVTNLNKQLEIKRATEGSNKTMQDALDDALEGGYKVENLTPTSGGKDIIWSVVEDKFFYVDSEQVPNDAKSDKAYDYFKVYTSMPATQTFSIYAKGTDWTSTVSGLKVGFDAGENKGIPSIEYLNTASREVVIRTNSAATNLTIDGEFDTVHHYGDVGKVTIDKIDTNCYNEFGKAAYVKLSQGKVTAKDGGEIKVVFATNEDASKVLVTKEGDATIEEAYTTAEIIDTTNQSNGGIPLTYSVEGNPVTEESIQDVVEEAVDELAGEEVAADPEAENYAARVGTKGYYTFKAAVDAAQEGEIVWILKDRIFLVDDIGEIVQEGPNAGEIQYGLRNEVKLSVDTTIEFGQYSISFLEGGKITRGDHTLTFVGHTSGSGIYNCQELEDEEGYTSTGITASILVDLAYHQYENELQKAFYYSESAGRWIDGNYAIGGGEPIGPQTDVEGSTFVDAIDVACEEDTTINLADYSQIALVGGETFYWETSNCPFMAIVGPNNGSTCTINCDDMAGMYDDLYVMCSITRGGITSKYHWSIVVEF